MFTDYDQGFLSAQLTVRESSIEWARAFLQSKREQIDAYTAPRVVEYWRGYADALSTR